MKRKLNRQAGVMAIVRKGYTGKAGWCIILLFHLLILAGCSKDSSGPDLPDRPGPGDENPPAFSIAVVDDDIKAFMTKYNVPGLSLAITKNSKLVYSKGYGYADKESLEKVDTASLFRIASLTKFITATAVMQLLEKSKFLMDDKVFGPGGVLGTIYGTQPYKQYVSDITVSHLLHHLSGGWGNSTNDPQFNNETLSADQLISWVIDNVPITSVPGTKADYSNFGFCILGRIVEKYSGLTFTEYVKQHILIPSGVKNMTTGNASYANRKTHEVKYYGYNGTNPYGYSSNVFARLDAVGGWVASATDLLRIMARIDDSSIIPDILQSSTIKTMMSTIPNSGRFACGMYISTTGNWYHGGALTGTRTWIVKTSSGFSWSILMNTRITSNDQYETDLDKLVWPAVNSPSTPWPDVNLF